MLDRKGKRKNTLIVLSSVVLVSFVLMTVNIRANKGPFFLESLALWIISPFQNALTYVVQTVNGVADHYLSLTEVARENEFLRGQIEELIIEKNVLLEELKAQGRLSELLDGAEEAPPKTLLSTIIGRDATQWSKVIFIDKGSRDGVRENLAVVNHQGVVGHVIQAGPATSKILLINDSRSAVDSLFQDTRVFGVVYGTGGFDIEMKYVAIDADVKVGDKVISSGMGGIFPKGRMVGTVSRVVRKKQGLFQEITLKPSADLSRLEEVLVLLP